MAERAGLSRVTLWRQGITRDGLLEGLLERLRADYRDGMWPVLTSCGGRKSELAPAGVRALVFMEANRPALN